MAAMTANTSFDLSDAPHILIVEDDPDIAQMLVELMAEGGFQASVAISGGEMNRLLGQRGADLIVLDAMLPGEDGFSICRRLRAAGKTPILMLTALSEDIDRILGLELGRTTMSPSRSTRGNSWRGSRGCCGGRPTAATPTRRSPA